MKSVLEIQRGLTRHSKIGITYPSTKTWTCLTWTKNTANFSQFSSKEQNCWEFAILEKQVKTISFLIHKCTSTQDQTTISFNKSSQDKFLNLKFNFVIPLLRIVIQIAITHAQLRLATVLNSMTVGFANQNTTA